MNYMNLRWIKGIEAGNPDLEIPQIWMFTKYPNLLVLLSRKKIL